MQAMTTWMLACVNTPKGKRKPKIDDYMPQFGEKKKQSNEEMSAVMSAFANAHNAVQDKVIKDKSE